jgi:GT2 family glycosyltransferase
MITIIVLNWNTKELLTPLLESLWAYTHQLDDGEAEVLIIEQGSVDGSVDVLKSFEKRFKWLKVKYLKENLGVQGGLNYGLKQTPLNNDVVWLSSDCEVLPNWLDGFLKLKDKRSQIGVMCAQLLDHCDYRGTYSVRFGGTTELITSPHVTGMLGQTFGLEEPTRQTWVTGACMYITSDCRKEIGVFDDRYKIYCGDRDYCYRAIEKGFEVWYCPWSKVYHLEAFSINRGLDKQVLKMSLSYDVKLMSQIWGIGDPVDVKDSEVKTTLKSLNKTPLELPSVTMVCVDSLNLDRALYAIRRTAKEIKCGKVKLFTHFDKPANVEDSIEFVKITPVNSRQDYSVFCSRHLNDYIDTKHFLIVQYDGYALNQDSWSDEFLQYDYIGPVVTKNHGGGCWSGYTAEFGERIVGNGGFSLRSKKLLEVIEKVIPLEVINSVDEDMAICILYRKVLEANGIKFAPPKIADKFAVLLDTPVDTYSDQFGWHGSLPSPEK